MGLYLIAYSLTELAGSLTTIALVAIGLGAVIFVHELGHFLVAKGCGVQCDKFYIGFDIYGLALWKRKWGETEYGIGILPLGGYVKMLGQDDNPARAAEEMRRARMAQESTAQVNGASEDATSETATGESGDSPATQYVLNPRSYLAKSVPQRMAIISAGVIMNLIFAFIFAVIAYRMGVPYLPSVVDGVLPGSPAWQANLKPGDEIVQIGEVRKPEFDDLRNNVTLGDQDNGVPISIARAGSKEEISLVIKPDKRNGLPTIGVLPAHSLVLEKPTPAVEKYLGDLQKGDEVLAVDGEPVNTYPELERILTAKPDKPLTFTVRRGGEPGESNAPGLSQGGKKLDIVVPPVPWKGLGMEMRIGRIVAVQTDSPADKAGLEPDDFIEKIDDKPIEDYDPILLPRYLRDKAVAGEAVLISIRRKGSKGESLAKELTISLRVPDWVEISPFPNSPMSAPALGIAYRVLNIVQRVAPNSPADRAKIVQNDQVTWVQFIPREDDESKLAQILRNSKPVEFDEEKAGWPWLVHELQLSPPGTQVKLTLKNATGTREVLLEPDAVAGQFDPRRGMHFELLQSIRRAETWGEAARLGLWRTQDSVQLVYRFLRKIAQYWQHMGGPITIFQAAGYSAAKGIPTLLIFLTVLSANLAVINFLPIPVLDGGHMVLLLVEGISRRPVSERIVVALQTLGFVFILGLMIFVIALDVNRLAQ